MRPNEARLGLNSPLVELCAVLREGASQAARRLGWTGSRKCRHVPSEKLALPFAMMIGVLNVCMNDFRYVGVV